MAKREHPAAKALREKALSYPGAEEHFPWGERVAKVKGKVFVFLGHPQEAAFGLSVKLPHSAEAALAFKFASPTGYGLGKAGWISAVFQPGDAVPLPLLFAWLDESYRAVAPKKLVATLDGAPPAGAKAKKPAKRAAAKKPARRTR